VTFQGFVEALQQAGCQTHVEDLLDTLWLATRGRHLALYPAKPEKQSVGAVPIEGEGKDDKPAEERTGTSGDRTDAQRQGGEPKADASPVYPAGRSASEPKTVKASAVALPAGQPLSGRLQLARALRPFCQRWPSRHAGEIDEERTVEASAERRGVLVPVFRPRRERWFDAHVVLEQDPAITLWANTLRGFCRMLEDTGAFRSVQFWRLRIPTERTAACGKNPAPAYLEAPTGYRASTLLLAGQGVRRLIFYVTHGNSTGWLDGHYARVLAPWVKTASLVILHLRDYHCWGQGTLGEPHGLCHVREPGAVTSKLTVEVSWWSLPAERTGLLPVPAVQLTPAGLSEWALMQMGRGRSSAVFLLDSDPPRDEGTGTIAASEDLDLSVALLKQSSPEAFRLAVYLSASAFTIAVARVIQEAQFGAAADQSHLAEVLLSGLVFAHSPEQSDADQSESYFELFPDARALLLRSLRESDAEAIGAALQERVSRYLERISGRPITFRALVPDANGKYRLPEWAQPFARFGVAVLRPMPDAKTPEARLKEFIAAVAHPLLIRIARCAAARTPGAVLQPGELEEGLLQPLRDYGLVAQDARGQWRFLPGIEPLLARRLEDLDTNRPTAFRDVFTDGSGDGPAMVWLPGGTFRMGSPEGVGYDNERPAHDVTLSHFGVGKYPVTVGEFRRFAEATDYKTEAEEVGGARVWNRGEYGEKKDASWRNPYMAQDDRHPVVCISWNDAKAYCEWLSRVTGQTYGLLSEAQWEYACRAGSETAYCFGDDAKDLEAYAWFGDSSASGSTHPVGEKKPNVWNVYDMHGNVWEWCADWYAEDYYEQLASSAAADVRGSGAIASGAASGASKDPSGPESSSIRVVRGGSWHGGAGYCRSASRDYRLPGDRRDYLGFRLSRTV
jgi:formylglycine-generating enzyme required for sulfatase activity